MLLLQTNYLLQKKHTKAINHAKTARQSYKYKIR